MSNELWDVFVTETEAINNTKGSFTKVGFDPLHTQYFLGNAVLRRRHMQA